MCNGRVRRVTWSRRYGWWKRVREARKDWKKKSEKRERRRREEDEKKKKMQRGKTMWGPETISARSSDRHRIGAGAWMRACDAMRGDRECDADGEPMPHIRYAHSEPRGCDVISGLDALGARTLGRAHHLGWPHWTQRRSTSRHPPDSTHPNKEVRNNRATHLHCFFDSLFATLHAVALVPCEPLTSCTNSRTHCIQHYSHFDAKLFQLSDSFFVFRTSSFFLFRYTLGDCRSSNFNVCRHDEHSLQVLF